MLSSLRYMGCIYVFNFPFIFSGVTGTGGRSFLGYVLLAFVLVFLCSFA